MAKAVRMHRVGGPEVLELEDIDVGIPGPGQVRLRHEAVGLNYADLPCAVAQWHGCGGGRGGRGAGRGREPCGCG